MGQEEHAVGAGVKHRGYASGDLEILGQIQVTLR